MSSRGGQPQKDDSTTPRHFVTGRFSRPFWGTGNLDSLAVSTSGYMRTSLMNDDHGDEFTCLLIYLFIHFSLLLAAFPQSLTRIPIIATSMHCRLFFQIFFFHWGRKTDTARRRRTAGDEWVGPRNAGCDQFICATGVFALALGFTKKKKKTACRAATQKKRRLGKSGFSMGAVETS
ncbi:hypothetical protein GGI35DRAFT_72223 [Trichoderma velutinum]